jgi:hypothetical protein
MSNFKTWPWRRLASPVVRLGVEQRYRQVICGEFAGDG